ncbi:MAG: hypothetical protein GY862_20895, partial [Gammaproteobacteria bacterium]|nr:hypothetical protein [Gammaproteobacteria bacterium]
THLKGIQTQKQPEERLRWKIRLFKALYKAQYARQDILNLVHFIDWVLALPKTLEQKFEQTITEYEEKKKVAYITSFERIGAKRGIKKGTKKGIKKGTKKGTKKGIKTGMLQKLQENVAEILSIRFKEIPEQLVKKIRSITDMAFLSELHRKAVLVESIPLFERIIEKHDEAAQDRQAA